MIDRLVKNIKKRSDGGRNQIKSKETMISKTHTTGQTVCTSNNINVEDYGERQDQHEDKFLSPKSSNTNVSFADDFSRTNLAKTA